jgi:hypothetical protein
MNNSDELMLYPGKYHFRIGKFALIPRYIYGVDRIVNIKQMILDHRMEGMDKIMSKHGPAAIAALEAQGKDSDISKFREVIVKDTKEDIEEYLPILFNQALVMMCTVFDVFLVDSLEVITKKQPKILHQLADKSDISVTDIINIPNYDAIFKIIQDKALSRFDFSGIKDKVKTLDKIGVDTKGVFNFKFQNDNPRKKFPDSYGIFISCYEKRNDIVHRDKLPIKSPDDLEYIADLFADLIMNFGWEMGEHFDIPTDFDLIQRVNEMQKQSPGEPSKGYSPQ